MNAPAAAGLPRWAAWAFLVLLVLPFCPWWVDFEQVRRGLLLLCCGVTLALLPRLPRVRGEVAWWVFVAFLGIAAVISIRSLQTFEAVYRIAHFAALAVVLRLGAAARDAIATPMSALLAATSAFGILQRLDLAAIGSYGTALEPVAVFGNTNVASEWTAVAAMAVLVLRTDRRILRLAALALAGGYLVVNGSRSGPIALGIGMLVWLLQQRNVGATLVTGVVVAGAGIGFLLTIALPPPAPLDGDAALALARRPTQTLEVRLEIAKSSAELFGERPLFGFGPGQFQVQYPRVRGEREIELSSHGRAFASEVRTAHDDWIELLVEGGLPALLLFAFALFALQRGQGDKQRLMPLFVLLLLMFARSPLANAPAVCAALLPVATALPGAANAAAWRAWSVRALGLLFAILGLLPVIAHGLFAPYVAAVARGERPDPTAAAAAHRWMWWEPRWLQVLAQEHLTLGNAGAAQAAAKMACKLRPHDPQLLLLLGSTLSNAGRYAEAATFATVGLQHDPANPELRVLRSTALMLGQPDDETASMRDRRHDDAITAVTADPHPTLRAQLGDHFAALAREAGRRGDAVGAARCRMERAFFAALETIGSNEPGALTATNEHLTAFATATAEAGRQSRDLRFLLLPALHFLVLDDRDTAIGLGENARRNGLTLPDWQRDLLGDRLAPLLEIESWFEVLRKRDRRG